MKEFADNNSKFKENDRKFSKMLKKKKKKENKEIHAISPFPTVFSKDMYCKHIKTRACLGNGKRMVGDL